MPLTISDTIYVNAAKTLVRKLEQHPAYDERVRKTIDDILAHSEDIHRSLSSLLQECENTNRINEGVQATLHAEWIAGLDHLSVGAEEPLV